jgi:alpha-amylase/alpha-mannosidase (GH57 family)
MVNKINLAFLWHMHQPNYVDPIAKEFIMPWVRLHAMQDYLDIPNAILKAPNAKTNINFVPSLLEQLEFYIERKYSDSYLIMVEKNAKNLTTQDKNFIVEKLFNINIEKVVLKSLRYRELFEKKEFLLSIKKDNMGEEFLEQELRDLQVHFQLGWSGTKLKEDLFIKELIKKDKYFTEEEKNELLNIQYKFLKDVKNYIKSLAHNERMEVSITPFYHPIAPVMNNIENVNKAWDNSIIPNNFSDMSYYSKKHVKKAENYAEEFFDKKITGMWPAEGSVSKDFLEILQDSNINWIATDEAILAKSKGYSPSLDELSTPYLYNNKYIFFRNHALSDKIGFVYSNWDKREAVVNFLEELNNFKNNINREEALVTVILDGENAWEYYEDHGEPFLTELFNELSKTNWINLTTFTEYIDKNKQRIPKLDNLMPGSWIDGNFNTWINEPVKNKYWEYIFHLNSIIENRKLNNIIDSETLKELEDYFMIAQGSDWMWWAGEGHSSSNDLDFDLLFRNYLIKIYDLLEIDTPIELFSPLYSKLEVINYKKPLHLITPNISGKLDDYYGWVSSGEILAEQGAIHKTDTIIKKVLFGFDKENLYLQISSSIDLSDFNDRNYVISIDFVDFNKKIDLISSDDGVISFIDEVCEASIKFSLIKYNFLPNEIIKFRILLKENDNIIERIPNTDILTIEYPCDDFDLTNWYV